MGEFRETCGRSKINSSSDSLTTFQLLEKTDLHKKVDQLTREMDAFELGQGSGVAKVATYL